MLLFTLFSLASLGSSALIPLGFFTELETMYKVTNFSKIYVVSDSPQDVLKKLTIRTDTGAQNTDAFQLSIPGNGGSLTPLIPTQASDLLGVVFTGTNTAKGWLYIDSVTQNLNVFPLLENKSINFKQGTNVFFKMSNPAGQIPIAENVVVGKNQSLSGFFGLPDDANRVKIFDSASINGVTNYKQLELPMEKFHFTSNSADVKYEIKYSARIGMTVGSSGLLMSDGFPSGDLKPTNDYDINNENGINVDAFMVPRLDKTRSYTGNVTVLMTPSTLKSLVFPLISYADSNITSNSPISRIVVESDGPYSIQFFLRDTSITTPFSYETTSSSIQYYTNSTSTNLSSNTVPLGHETTPSIITTTKSSRFLKTSLPLFTVSFLLYL